MVSVGRRSSKRDRTEEIYMINSSREERDELIENLTAWGEKLKGWKKKTRSLTSPLVMVPELILSFPTPNIGVPVIISYFKLLFYCSRDLCSRLIQTKSTIFFLDKINRIHFKLLKNSNNFRLEYWHHNLSLSFILSKAFYLLDKI